MVADFQKKQKGELLDRKVVFQIAGVVLLLIFIALLVANARMFQRKRELASQIKEYDRQIEEIQKNNATLKEEIANQDDTDYIEKVAYEQLGEQRPGEREVIFINAPDKNAEAGKPQERKDWTPEGLRECY